jgi:hypothetical protein
VSEDLAEDCLVAIVFLCAAKAPRTPTIAIQAALPGVLLAALNSLKATLVSAQTKPFWEHMAPR